MPKKDTGDTEGISATNILSTTRHLKKRCSKCNGPMIPVFRAKSFAEVFDKNMVPNYHMCMKCNIKEKVINKDFKPWKPIENEH
jgi:uncharacterized protein with PIN domain